MSGRQQRSTTLVMDMPNYKARGPGTSTSRSSSVSWTAMKTAGQELRGNAQPLRGGKIRTRLYTQQPAPMEQ